MICRTHTTRTNGAALCGILLFDLLILEPCERGRLGYVYVCGSLLGGEYAAADSAVCTSRRNRNGGFREAGGDRLSALVGKRFLLMVGALHLFFAGRVEHKRHPHL